MTASLRRGNRFASDSPFEGEGFELRVPLARKVASRGGEGAGGRSRWSRKACSFSRGTRGSSPSPSSKESATNLTGKNEPALARNRRFESVSLRHLPTQKENLAGGVAGDAPHVTAKFRAQHSASVPGYRSGPPSFPDGLRRNGSVRVYRLSPAGFSEHGHIQCQRLAALHLHGLAPSPRASVCRPRGLCRIKKCLLLD